MKFDYIISLGYNCSNASSMAKNGFRSFSGPFDWCVIPYDALIHFLETNFSDFLEYDNLQLMSGEDKCFNDIKYKLTFPHEIKKSLQDDFSNIKDKYNRRIDKFRSILGENICFIRMIYHQEEVDKIIKDNNYLKNIILRYNSSNELVYLISKKLNIPVNFPQNYYIFNEHSNYSGLRDRLRHAYDTVNDNALIEYLIRNYDSEKRTENLYFDQKNEMMRMNWINTMNALIDSTDFSKKNNKYPIVIYGASDIGAHLLNSISGMFVIKCFVDKFFDDNNFKGIPVYNLRNYKHEKDTIIVVTPVKFMDQIINDLVNKCNVSPKDIVSLINFCKSC